MSGWDAPFAFSPSDKTCKRFASACLSELCGDEVAELRGAERVPFQIRRESPTFVDDHGVQGVIDEPFVGKRVDAEELADPCDVGVAAGQEVPRRIRAPLRGIASQYFLRIVCRIERDCQERQLLAKAIGKALLQRREVGRQPQAKFGSAQRV